MEPITETHSIDYIKSLEQKYNKLIEQRRTAVKKWNDKNKDKMELYRKSYLEKNKEKLSKYTNEYQKSHPEKYKTYQYEYRQRIKRMKEFPFYESEEIKFD